MAGHYGAQAKPIVPALLKRLEKPDDLLGRRPDNWRGSDEFVVVMNTLAAIGPAAKEALPRLQKLREKPPKGSIEILIVGGPNKTKTYREIIDETIEKISKASDADTKTERLASAGW